MIFNFNKVRCGKTGFSLVEVLMALAIVAFSVLVVFGLFSSGLETAQDSVADTQASVFARDVFNGIRMMHANSNEWKSSIESIDNYNILNTHPLNPDDYHRIPPVGDNIEDPSYAGWIPIPKPGQKAKGIIYFMDE